MLEQLALLEKLKWCPIKTDIPIYGNSLSKMVDIDLHNASWKV